MAVKTCDPLNAQVHQDAVIGLVSTGKRVKWTIFRCERLLSSSAATAVEALAI